MPLGTNIDLGEILDHAANARPSPAITGGERDQRLVYSIEVVLDEHYTGPTPFPHEVTDLVRQHMGEHGYPSSPDGWRIVTLVTGSARIEEG